MEIQHPQTSSTNPFDGLTAPALHNPFLVAPQLITVAEGSRAERGEQEMIEVVADLIRRIPREARSNRLELVELGGWPGAWAKRCVAHFPMLRASVYDPMFQRKEQLLVRRADRGELRPLELGKGPIPHPDNSVQFVTASFFTMYLDDSAVRQVLGEVKRVLRPGGSLILNLIHPQSEDMPASLKPTETRIEKRPWLGEQTSVYFRGGAVEAALLQEAELVTSRVVDIGRLSAGNFQYFSRIVQAVRPEAESE
jgi:SAM-dependent methyltransferase